jgi:sugar fermentation stimulation protein A
MARVTGGVYIAVFVLDRRRRIGVGRLGRFAFPAGVYLYVGSAQRGLDARLRRHARRRKALRWHVDYLSTRARMLGAVVVGGPKARECELARRLARHFGRHVRGFGASDCRCGGHLFLAERLTAGGGRKRRGDCANRPARSAGIPVDRPDRRPRNRQRDEGL